MKAVVIKNPKNVTIEEVEIPEFFENDILIKPTRGGICGTDVHIYDGDFIGNYPVIPCHEFVGIVSEIGSKVTNVKVGDSVIIDPNIRCGKCSACLSGKPNCCGNYEATGVTMRGGFVEVMKIPSENAYKIENCSHEIAAFAEPLACVLYGQSRINLNPGKEVVIFGAGAIGLLHMLSCIKLHGENVTVVDLNPKRLELAKSLGAKNTIQISSTSDNQFLKLFPNGYDIAIDATGSVKALDTLFKFLKKGGEALLFSVYPPEDKFSISPFDIFLNDWKIAGSLTYNHEFKTAVKLLDDGIINPEELIDLSVTLDQVPKILDKLAKKEIFGKIQVKIQ